MGEFEPETLVKYLIQIVAVIAMLAIAYYYFTKVGI
jgi:hypothetical protein